MTKKQLPIIERVAKIKEVWALHDAGVNKYDISKQTGVAYGMVLHMVSLKWRAKYTKDMHLIENMSDHQLDGAIKNYFDVKLISDLINGRKLSQFAGMYFVALHLDGKYENHKRERNRQAQLNSRQDNSEEKEAARAFMRDLKQAKQNAGAEFGIFQDDPRIKRAPVVSVHGKSSGLGYGCAANMCAEA
jgi:hypothetical protein